MWRGTLTAEYLSSKETLLFIRKKEKYSDSRNELNRLCH